MNKQFCRCCSIGLVCTCLAQGVKAPPAAVVRHVFTVTVAVASTATMMATMPDTVLGKVYDLPCVDGSELARRIFT